LICLDVYFVKLSSVKSDLDVNWFMFDCISKRMIFFLYQIHVLIVWMKIDFECVNCECIYHFQKIQELILSLQKLELICCYRWWTNNVCYWHLSDLLGWVFIILKENLSHFEGNDNDDLHEPIQTGMSWSTITTPGGSGSGGGTRAGLFRTPISGGVQSATSAHGLPRPALAVRNLMEQVTLWLLYIFCCIAEHSTDFIHGWPLLTFKCSCIIQGQICSSLHCNVSYAPPARRIPIWFIGWFCSGFNGP
jgi:hypothetical protein